MNETTVKIELGKEDLQLASTEVIKHLTLNPPTGRSAPPPITWACRCCLMCWNRHSKMLKRSFFLPSKA